MHCAVYGQSEKQKKQVRHVTVPSALLWSYDIVTLDKEYRKAVHWLETLRLRRVKILEGGYNVSTLHPTSVFLLINSCRV